MQKGELTYSANHQNSFGSRMLHSDLLAKAHYSLLLLASSLQLCGQHWENWVDSVETNDLGVKSIDITEKLTRKPRTQWGWTTTSWLLLQLPAPIWQTSPGLLPSSRTLSRHISSRVLRGSQKGTACTFDSPGLVPNENGCCREMQMPPAYLCQKSTPHLQNYRVISS